MSSREMKSTDSPVGSQNRCCELLQRKHNSISENMTIQKTQTHFRIYNISENKTTLQYKISESATTFQKHNNNSENTITFQKTLLDSDWAEHDMTFPSTVFSVLFCVL